MDHLEFGLNSIKQNIENLLDKCGTKNIPENKKCYLFLPVVTNYFKQVEIKPIIDPKQYLH
jgi:hypothetical protein